MAAYGRRSDRRARRIARRGRTRWSAAGCLLGALLAWGGASPSAATSIAPLWTDPVEPTLVDAWGDVEGTPPPDLGESSYGATVRRRPKALLDLHGVIHPTHEDAPSLPSSATEALESAMSAALTDDPTEPEAARLDTKTDGAPLPWDAPSQSVFADVLRNVPERVARLSEYGMRDVVITGLVAGNAALPPPEPTDQASRDEARSAARSAAIASSLEASPTGASPNDRGPIIIILAIVVLMSAAIIVIARPASPKPQLLRARRFGH